MHSKLLDSVAVWMLFDSEMHVCEWRRFIWFSDLLARGKDCCMRLRNL